MVSGSLLNHWRQTMEIRKGSGGRTTTSDGSNVLLNIRGNEIRKGSGSTKVLLNIKGNDIRKGSGSKVLYNSAETLSKIQLVAVLYALGEIKGSGKGGCFIATATMEDYNHPVVMQLREFRDQYLLERNWGKKFTKYYYKFGPYPAKVISKSNLLKKVSYVFIVKPLSFVVQKIMNKKE